MGIRPLSKGTCLIAALWLLTACQSGGPPPTDSVASRQLAPRSASPEREDKIASAMVDLYVREMKRRDQILAKLSPAKELVAQVTQIRAHAVTRLREVAAKDVPIAQRRQEMREVLERMNQDIRGVLGPDLYEKQNASFAQSTRGI